MSTFQRLPKRFYPGFRAPGVKPFGSVELDKGNPLADGLVCLIPFVETSGSKARDLVSGELIDFGSRLRSRFLDGDGASQVLIPVDGLGSSTTMLYVLTPASGTANQYISDWSGGNEFAIIQGYQDNYYNMFGGSYPTNKANASRLPMSGGTDTVSYSIESNSAVLGYVNSSKVVSVTRTHGDFTPTSPLNLRPQYTGKIHFIAIWNRGLSEAEHSSVHGNPYQLLKPVRDHYGYHIPGGGAGAVFADLNTSWSLIEAIYSDIDLRSQILQSIAADTELRWSLLGSVWSDAEIRSSLIEAVSSDTDLSWEIQAALSSVSSDISAQWSVVESVLSDSTVGWQVLASVLSDASISWQLLEAVLSDSSLLWTVDSALSTISADLGLHWNIIAEVYASLSAQWNLLDTVTSDSSLRWSILDTLSRDLTSNWEVRAAVQRGASIQWDVIATTEQEVSLRWRIDSESQFPDLTGTVTINSSSPNIDFTSLTPKTNIQ